MTTRAIFRRYIALPQDHGSWVFVLSPLSIGLFAGGQITLASFLLILGTMAGFLIRQPATILIKVYSGRRPKRDLPSAYFWAILYAMLGLVSLLGLIMLGYGYVLYLVLPGIPVFAWHLLLVSRRLERRQMGIEVVASGVLALAAPGAFWVGLGKPDPMGWLLWLLTWLQSAASIVYAYLRLEQRDLPGIPELSTRLRMAYRAILYTTFNLALAIILSVGGVIPQLLPLPYAVQWTETLWGSLHPAIGVKPTGIGIRQLAISTLFTGLFIVAWNL